MGRYIHAVEPLLSPLHFLDERMFHLHAGKSLYTVPEHPMVLIFLDANHELILQERPPLRIVTGDIAVFPANLPRVYRKYAPPKTSKLSRHLTPVASGTGATSYIHVMRVLFKFPENTRPPSPPPPAPSTQRQHIERD